MEHLWGNQVYAAIIALFAAMMLVGWINSAFLASPSLWIFRRWLRCAFFSLTIAVFLQYFLPDRSFTVLVCSGALFYFLAETFLYWAQISAINFAEDVFFARYKETENAWSAQKRHILLKERILKSGFKKAGSFKANLVEGVDIFMTVFDSDDSLVRMCVAFLPYGSGSIMSTSLTSRTSDMRIETDSSPVPFGLAYPKRYSVENRFFASDPLRLLKIHRRRIADAPLEPVDEQPLRFLNGSLEEIEGENIRRGFINEARDRAEDGYLTSEGKFLFWKDTVRSNYFPFL